MFDKKYINKIIAVIVTISFGKLIILLRTNIIIMGALIMMLCNVSKVSAQENSRVKRC